MCCNGKGATRRRQGLSSRIKSLQTLVQNLERDQQTCDSFLQHAKKQVLKRNILKKEDVALEGLRRCVLQMVQMKTGPASVSLKVAREAYAIVKATTDTLMDPDRLSYFRSEMDAALSHVRGA